MMNIRFKRHFYQDQAGDGSGGPGDGSGSGATGASSAAGGDAAGSAGSGVVPAASSSTVSDAEAKLLKENMKKKEQIDALAKQVESAKQLQAQLEELGGLETVRSLVQAQKDAETKQLEAKGDFERLKARMAEEHDKEVKAMAEKLKQAEENLAKRVAVIQDLTVGTQFGQSKFVLEELALPPSKARVIYADYFDIGEDGSVVGYDKPKGAANRTPIVDSHGNAVNFDAALRTIVEADPEKDHLLRSKTRSGAASQSKANATASAQQQAKQVTSIGKIAAGLAGLGQMTNGGK